MAVSGASGVPVAGQRACPDGVLERQMSQQSGCQAAAAGRGEAGEDAGADEPVETRGLRRDLGPVTAAEQHP